MQHNLMQCKCHGNGNCVCNCMQLYIIVIAVVIATLRPWLSLTVPMETDARSSIKVSDTGASNGGLRDGLWMAC